MNLKLVEKQFFGDDIVMLGFSSQELVDMDVHGKNAMLSIDGEKKRSFSIGMKTNDNTIVFFIKKVGSFTKALAELELGENIICANIFASSFGRNLCPVDEKICCIGGGVGVSPLINLLTHNKNPNSVLLSSYRLICEAINNSDYVKDINMISKTFITREEVLPHKFGRIEKDDITIYGKDFCGFFVCGTKNFCNSIVDNLLANGIDKSKIFTESW
ncbi:MAG: hypothetical protein ACRCSK_04965 [Fusobacteriaceae bacterium]